MILDTALAARLRKEISEQISTELEALLVNTTERQAGRIQGLRDALAIMDGTLEKLNNPEKRSGG